MSEVERILVIKLGALGDFVQALGPMAAVRKHHADAKITLLTTKPFADFAKATNLFDEVWIDERPKLFQISKVLELRRRLKGGKFKRVYDFQTSDRSAFYFHLMGAWLGGGARPQWSGAVAGASHAQTNPDRDRMHTVERQRDQLRVAGIEDVSPADLSWAASDLSALGIRSPYALLVPGGAQHRPQKRWPTDNFTAIARHMLSEGITPVLIGSDSERGILSLIARDCPGAVNLAGKTDFIDIATLGRGAELALGNDTGPMHILAAAGAPSVVLFSSSSDPALCLPRGGRVRSLRRADLKWLDPVEVWTVLSLMRATNPAMSPPAP